MEIHWLESFCFPEIYDKYGVVWQIACQKKVPLAKDNLSGTTNYEDVTCGNCLRYAKEKK